MSHRVPFVLTFVVLSLSGCEVLVDIDPDDHEPVLVVESRFEPGVPWTVYVGRTVALGDTAGDFSGVPPVPGATVVVTDDLGRTTPLPETAEGFGAYGAGFDVAEDGTATPRDGPAPEVGRTYTVRVAAPGFAPVTAVSSTPPSPAVTAHVTGGWDPLGLESSLGEAQAFSPVGLAVRLVPSSTATRHELQFVTAHANPAGADPCALQPGEAYAFTTDAPLIAETTFLEDAQGGQGRVLRAALDLSALPSTPEGAVAFGVTGESPGPCLAGVEVVALSTEATEAERSATRRRSSEGNPFAEPVPVFSNVRGGAGVFAGSTRTRAVVRRID